MVAGSWCLVASGRFPGSLLREVGPLDPSSSTRKRHQHLCPGPSYRPATVNRNAPTEAEPSDAPRTGPTRALFCPEEPQGQEHQGPSHGQGGVPLPWVVLPAVLFTLRRALGRFSHIFPDFSDFLGRLRPSKTTIRKTLNTLGVEESSSPRRVLHC